MLKLYDDKKTQQNNYNALKDLHFNKYDEGFNAYNFNQSEVHIYELLLSDILYNGLHDTYFISEKLKDFLESHNIKCEYDFTDNYNNKWYMTVYYKAA